MDELYGYPAGSDITILNTIYHKESKDKKYTDYLTLICKDNKTGKKFNRIIKNPMYDFYLIKEEYRVPENQKTPMFMPVQYCEKVSVPYMNVEKSLAELTGNLDFFYDNIRNGNANANRVLHTAANYLMGSDMNIEDFYRAEFSNLYTNELFTPKKAFFDIETNVKYCNGQFPEMGEVPINAITLINKDTNQIITLLLREQDNPQINDFENSMGPELFNELKQFIITSVGGPKKAKKFGIDKLEPTFMFFDNEIDLISMLFIQINTLQPDFVLAWNIAFDLPYIIARIEKLGYDPKDIICGKDFEHKVCRYYVDTRADDIAERGDFAQISINCVFLDQMIAFASRRKGQQKFESYALDDIGENLVGVKKLSWYKLSPTFANFPYVNYKMFVFYNIIDVIVQVCIESKSDDVGYVFNSAIMNNTRYHKVYRQSVYLRNRFSSEWKNEGLIMGNNTNIYNKKVDKFVGAIIHDPLHSNDFAKMLINGRPSNIVENAIDYDYKAMYPNIMAENNIAPFTQIGKAILYRANYVLEPYNRTVYYSTEGRYMDNLCTQNDLLVGSRYFNLAGFKLLLDDAYEYMANNPTYGFERVNKNGYRTPVRFVTTLQPVSILDNKVINPVHIYSSGKEIYKQCQEDLKRSVIV